MTLTILRRLFRKRPAESLDTATAATGSDQVVKPDPGDVERQSSPEKRAGYLSRILLLWITPLIWHGWRKPLEDSDMPELLDCERGSYTTKSLMAAWRTVSSRKSAPTKSGRTLSRSIFLSQAWMVAFTAVLKAVTVGLDAAQPVLINRILVFLRNRKEAVGIGYLWAVFLFLVPALKSLIENHYFLSTMRAGMRVRSALQGILYHKSLSMSPSARASATVGEIVNLMQLDAQRAAEFSQYFHVLWGAPLQIIVTVALLFNYIGVSAIFGLVITFAVLPLQGHLMKVAMRLRAQGVAIADRRVKSMNEILQGIKAVKFYAWEQPFANQITDIRTEELKVFGKTVLVRSGFVTLMMIVPTLIAVITFSFFTAVFHNKLLPERVFTGIALLNQLRTPVIMLPMVINAYIDAKLAAKRIEFFLRFEDTDSSVTLTSAPVDDGNGKKEQSLPCTDASSSDDHDVSGAPGPVLGGDQFVASDSNVTNDDSKRSSPPTTSSTSVTAPHVTITNASFAWGQPSGSISDVSKRNKNGLFAKCLPGRKKQTDRVQPAHDGRARNGTNTENGADAGADNSGAGPSKAVADRPFLKDVSLRLRQGELTAVVGRVGAGKTSLVNALVGEMKMLSGDVDVSGSVAYVAQSAWIFNGTLRSNILFGYPYNEKRYRRAVKVSALEMDIAVLPAGDMTAIGEKGINLSGGQKQRVSIARAVYADADIYVFDDPLSALDSHVGQSVFEKCISRKGLLSSKLRILVTNQLHVLPECDKVIYMDHGSVRGVGPYTDLLQNPDFRSLVAEVEKENDESDTEEIPLNGSDVPGDISKGLDERDSLSKNVVEMRMDLGVGAAASTHSSQNREKQSKGGYSIHADTSKGHSTAVVQGGAGANLMQEEERETGNIIVKAYYRYALACGGVFLFSLILLLSIAGVSVSVLVNWWLVYWSQDELKGGGSSSRSLGFYLGIYFALGLLFAILTFWRSVWYLRLALRASESLHRKMLNGVLRAPMSFFETTPIGRIISRFARDVNAVDQLLPQAFSQLLTTLLSLLASYIYIATVFPLFIAAAVPVTCIYYLLQRFYNRTSIELKRLDSISKSPIYAHFSETLGGLSTIRAYNKQDQFRNENMKMIDINQRAYFLTIASNRWFSLYLEVFGASLVFATALFAVITRSSNNPGTAAAVGLSLTYALQVTSVLGFTIRSITELELQMNSVERMNYYGSSLPEEAPRKREDDPKMEDGVLSADDRWPSHGAIQFNDIKLKYREELDMVLKGVSLHVSPGEKIGIVGRTGSGKSTLMLALLRLVELAGGSIIIDGKDIAKLGLDVVRTNITIIPQDPVMFSGTVRFNLDPFGIYSEAELWDALEKSHLKEFVEEFEGGLDAKVSEYGENMSAGQRQLVCLTRALLRKSKILIMDEASSSLDYETDRLLQESIQTNMKEATVLTIAHRLWTLTNCDKILVLNDGLATEFDAPEVLLSRDNSELCFLVESMGEDGAARFRELVDINARRVGRI